MNTPDPLPPTAIPWYRSAVLKGILTVIVAQLIGRIQATYHIDLSVMGLDVNDIVSWAMDAISSIAAGYVIHARVTKPMPSVTLTKAAAAEETKAVAEEEQVPK